MVKIWLALAALVVELLVLGWLVVGQVWPIGSGPVGSRPGHCCDDPAGGNWLERCAWDRGLVPGGDDCADP